MLEIKQEIEANRKKIVALTAQVEDCTKKTTMARTVIATLSSRQSTLEGSKKQLKGADLKKIETAVEKIDKELDGARNQMTVAETQCSTLKEDISKVTGVVVQYNQEWKYYTTILVTIKKEIDEAEKSAAKGMEEDKEEEDDKKDEKKDDKKEGKDDKKEEGEEKKEDKEEKKPKKEKV
jgi:chromosome segregation ATPase